MNRNRIAVTGILVLSLILSFGLMAETFKANPAESNIQWEGQKITGSHTGDVKVKAGEFKIDGESMHGQFEIDMSTIEVTDGTPQAMKEKLQRHLHSDDFFSVENHPTSVFKIKEITPQTIEGSDENYRVTGELTIKGITHQIYFPAKIDIDGDRFSVKANVKIDRTKWDVRFRSGSFFENLGDKLIYDDIHLKLDIAGSKG